MRDPSMVRENGSDKRQSMADGLARHLERLDSAMEIKSTEAIKPAVLAGMGSSFLSAHNGARRRRLNRY